MYELNLCRENEAQKVSILFGNQLIEDDSQNYYPDTGAWIPLPQKYQTITRYRNNIVVNLEGHDILIGDWPENEDPFTQADLLDSEDDQVQQLIFQIRISISIPNNERIANRLNSLFNAAKEEDPDSPGISVNSLRSLYIFLKKHTYLKYPIITLTPDNNIYISWKGGQNQVFSLHFVLNEDVHFVIFKPNENNPERKIISYGTDTVNTLMKTVAFSGIWDWISDER